MKPPAKICPACGDGYEGDVLFCPKDGTPLANPKAPTLAGMERDPYLGIELAGQIRLKHLIGIGSMGRVYRAFQSGIDRDVAVKILHRELSSNQELVGRFHREAKVASRLVHPHVVQVLMTGAVPFCADPGIGGELYLVMEHLDGISLLSALAAGGEGSALPLPRALHIALQICDAVGEAHIQGIVHRDIKPENVMLVRRADDPNYVKVLDFGIARLTWGDSSLATTKAGLIFGTAKYISPEGAEGQPVGPQADVYAIATILYQCLSGKTPFDGDTPVALLLQHTSAPAPDLRSIARASYVPAPVARVVMANLAKKPGERAANARALGRDLIAAVREAGLDAEEIAGSVAALAGRPGAVRVASRERTKALQLSPELAGKIGGLAASPTGTLAGMPATPSPGDASDPSGASPSPAAAAETGSASRPWIARPAATQPPNGAPVAGAAPVQATVPEAPGDADPARYAAPGKTVPGEPPPAGAFRPPPSNPGRRPNRRGGAPLSRGGRRPSRPPGLADVDFDDAPEPATSTPVETGVGKPLPIEHAGTTSAPPPAASSAPPAAPSAPPPARASSPSLPSGAALARSSAPAIPSPPSAPHSTPPGPVPRTGADATTASLAGTEAAIESSPAGRAALGGRPSLRSWLVRGALALAAVAALALVVLGGRQLGGGDDASLDGRIHAARDAMRRHAWEGPVQPNVKEIVEDARSRWPRDPRVADLLREASERLVADALGRKYAGDHDGALRLARLAAELSADVTAAQHLVAELEASPTAEVAPATSAEERPRKTTKTAPAARASGAPGPSAGATATPSAEAVLPPTPPPLPSGHAPAAPTGSGPWL